MKTLGLSAVLALALGVAPAIAAMCGCCDPAKKSGAEAAPMMDHGQQTAPANPSQSK